MLLFLYGKLILGGDEAVASLLGVTKDGGGGSRVPTTVAGLLEGELVILGSANVLVTFTTYGFLTSIFSMRYLSDALPADAWSFLGKSALK